MSNNESPPTTRMVDYDPETIEKLLVAGWIERDGNHLKMTAKGQAALRRGFVGGVPGEQKLAIDSGRARARPSIRKKRKSHQ